MECLYFLDIYSIIPNSKDPLKVCILRRLKQLEFWAVFINILSIEEDFKRELFMKNGIYFCCSYILIRSLV
ncbi:hypothetical protein HpDR29_06330 [Helicobacter pylori]